MSSCIFCQIAQHRAQAKIVFENDHVVAFDDIRPQAPVHILICPKKHIPTLNDVSSEDYELLAEMFRAAQALAAERGVAQKGYRTLFNVNAGAGQTVFHLHLHLTGGRVLSFP